MVSDLGKQNGYSARFISEKMLGDDGTREVAFELNKQPIKAKILRCLAGCASIGMLEPENGNSKA